MLLAGPLSCLGINIVHTVTGVSNASSCLNGLQSDLPKTFILLHQPLPPAIPVTATAAAHCAVEMRRADNTSAGHSHFPNTMHNTGCPSIHPHPSSRSDDPIEGSNCCKLENQMGGWAIPYTYSLNIPLYIPTTIARDNHSELVTSQKHHWTTSIGCRGQI